MTGILIFPAALALSFWGRISVRIVAGPGSEPGLFGASLSALLGCAGVLLAIRIGPGVETIEAELAICVFGGLLILAAWVDRKTAWAPDGIILPLMFGAATAASLIGTLELGPLSAFGVGLVIFLAAQLIWVVQVISGFRLLPPADLMALVLPFLLFGITAYAPLTYLLMSAALFAALRGPEPLYLALRGRAADEALQDAGLRGSGRSAPFLPMALGALFAALLLRLTLG
jgi:hypothetical protein